MSDLSHTTHRGDRMPIRAARALPLVACVALGLLAPTGTAAAAPPPGTIDRATVLIQAHRGGPALGAPQNSLALFQKAIDSHVVDRIETDVRATKDDVLVIMHDAKLRQGCDSAGTPIRSLTWKQLQAVRCEGEPIPKVSQVLDLVRGTAMTLNLELKLDKTMSAKQKYAFAKQVATTVVAAGLPRSQVVISSFYWRSFAGAVQKYGKGTAMTAMQLAHTTDPTDAVFSTVRKAKALGVDNFTLPVADTSSGLVDFLRSYGRMNIGLGDRRDETDTRYALAQGLRTFTYDDPVAGRKSVDALLDRVDADPLQLSLSTTTVPSVVLLKSTAMAKGSKKQLLVFGSKRLPTSALARMAGLQLTVKIVGKGKGKVEVAPSGSRPGVDGTRVAIPNGTTTLTLSTTPGDAGQIRVYTTGTAKVSVTMTGYQTASY